MTEKEVKKKIREGRKVRLIRPDDPRSPYIGTVAKNPKGEMWFGGKNDKGEGIIGKVEPEEILSLE
ncbi:MAG: hypothetical protein Q7K28_00855 [Candidatus Wildermuthbacteria bacterium]|nr:hypothetical protein [Candidatus Wildermuthbacteria bacterium]